MSRAKGIWKRFSMEGYALINAEREQRKKRKENHQETPKIINYVENVSKVKENQTKLNRSEIKRALYTTK